MSFNQTAKQVSASITKVDGKALRTAIQTACVHVIGHAMEHGHSPLANALDDRMNLSPMLKRCNKAVQSFLVGNGPFNYSKDTGYVFSKVKRDAMRDDGYEFDSFAEGAPMWDDVVTQDKKDATFDAFKKLEKLVQQAERKVQSGECIDAALVPYMKALLGQYAGRKAIATASASSAATTPAFPTIDAPAAPAVSTDELRAALDAAGVPTLTEMATV